MKLPDTTLAYYNFVFRLRVRTRDAYHRYRAERRALNAMWAQRARHEQAELRGQVRRTVTARRRYMVLRDLLSFVLRDTRN
jgi:hypothetical protein